MSNPTTSTPHQVLSACAPSFWRLTSYRKNREYLCIFLVDLSFIIECNFLVVYAVIKDTLGTPHTIGLPRKAKSLLLQLYIAIFIPLVPEFFFEIFSQPTKLQKKNMGVL